MSAGADESVGTKTLRGLLWTYGSYIANRLATLAALVVLARVLTREEFGLAALVIVYVTLLETVRFGVTQALVVSDDDNLERYSDSAFVVGMAMAIGLFLFGAAMSPLIADFHNEPQALWMMVALSANFVVRGLGMTHYAIAQRALEFRGRTFAEVGNAIARGAVSVILAFMGFGAWSLIIGFLAGSAVFSLVLWITVSFRPRLRVSRADARHLFSFGGALTAVDILWAITASIPELAVQKVLGSAALGLYTLGQRLPELIVLQFSIVAGQVFYPAFAALKGAAIVDGLKTAYRYTLILTLPLTVFAIIMAEPLILTAFGSKWRDSIEPMQALAIYAFGFAIGIPAGSVLKAIGRPGILVISTITRLVLTAASVMYVLVVLDQGIFEVALAVAGVTVLLSVAETIIPPLLLGFSPLSMLAQTLPAIRSTLPLVAVLIGIMLLDLPSIVALVAAGVLGAAVYFGALWLMDRQSLMYILDKVRPA